MTAKTDTKPQTLPADLAAVALIDAPTCAAPGQMSVSWWHEEVRTGRAPAPVVRQPRCTRWLASEVAAFWADLAAKGRADLQAAASMKARATKASAAAKAKRMAQGAAA